MKHVGLLMAICSGLFFVFCVSDDAVASALVVPTECASNPYLKTDYLNVANALELTQSHLVRLKSTGVDLVHLPRWTQASTRPTEVKKVFDALQLGIPSPDLDESLRVHLQKNPMSPSSVQAWSAHEARVASSLGLPQDDQLAREIQAMIYEVSRQKLNEMREKTLLACRMAHRDGLDSFRPSK